MSEEIKQAEELLQELDLAVPDNNIETQELNIVEDGPDEVVVTIGEEPPTSDFDEQKAPEWVRELRKTHRETVRRNRELEQQLAAVSAPQQPPAEILGVKPKIDDFDYDAELYEKALDNWYTQKRSIDDAVAKADVEKQTQQQAWQQKLELYNKAKVDLRVSNFEDAELEVQNSLSTVQQGIVLQGAENPALVIYAVGQNPAKAKELGAINDPVKFAFAIAKLEAQLKITNRKTTTAPEKTVRGTGPTSGAVDSQLERLRADALRSGDYSRVIAYKKQKR